MVKLNRLCSSSTIPAGASFVRMASPTPPAGRLIRWRLLYVVHRSRPPLSFRDVRRSRRAEPRCADAEEGDLFRAGCTRVSFLRDAGDGEDVDRPDSGQGAELSEIQGTDDRAVRRM